MEKMMTSFKEVGDSLLSFASRNGIEPVQVFNDFLRYSCDMMEWKKIDESGGIVERMKQYEEKNNFFFKCFTAVCGLTYEENKRGYSPDAFGSVYEQSFKSSAKASRMGQFFTPMSVCRLMSELTLTKHEPTHEVVAYNDCACGSGRTLLTAWEKCDKYEKNYFVAQDIDPTSVMMCALNMMLNGMVGIVECQDTLSMEWKHGYIVNACKVPYANNMACLERYDDRDTFRARERKLMLLTSMWDVEKYRPKQQSEIV